MTRNKQLGFSLFELVVVMVVVAILSAIVFVMWPGKAPALKAQSIQLAHDLRYARHYAITQEISTKISFNTASKQYSLINSITSGSITLPGSNQNTANLDSSFTMNLTNLPNSFIIFDQDGLPYNATSGSALTSNAIISLTTAGKTELVTINAHSGAVSINS